MKRAMIVAVLVGVAASPLLAGARGTVTGAYVEARTAEVFTGGCIMNSEAETVGKQAVLAWRVNKHLTHDPTCGAMQWFHPLASVDDAAIGVASQHVFTGSALGTKWSDPNKRSAFFGTFTY